MILIGMLLCSLGCCMHRVVLKRGLGRPGMRQLTGEVPSKAATSLLDIVSGWGGAAGGELSRSSCAVRNVNQLVFEARRLKLNYSSTNHSAIMSYIHIISTRQAIDA